LNNYILDSKLMSAIAKLPKVSRDAAIREIGKIEWQRCADDIMYWADVNKHPAMAYVYTHDPHVYFICNHCNDDNEYQAKQRKIHMKVAHNIIAENESQLRQGFRELPTNRPFPMKEYMPPIIDAWLNEQYLLVEKSRDMIATWTIVMCYAWDTFFHKGRQNIFQSEDTTKTFDLCKRAWHMYRHQPKFLKPYKTQAGQGVAKAGHIRFEELNSEILGFPQGADQIRQFHPSGIFLDEAAFLKDAGDTFAAIKPSIENGGRFTAISSANPSWFWKATLDELDQL
jgi:hypothetical protein